MARCEMLRIETKNVEDLYIPVYEDAICTSALEEVRRGFEDNLLVFREDGTMALFVYYEDEQPRFTTRILNEVSYVDALSNEALDVLGRRIRVQKRFAEDRLSYLVGSHKELVVNGKTLDKENNFVFEPIENGYRLLHLKREKTANGYRIANALHMPVVSHTTEGLVWFIEKYVERGLIDYANSTYRRSLLWHIYGPNDNGQWKQDLANKDVHLGYFIEE